MSRDNRAEFQGAGLLYLIAGKMLYTGNYYSGGTSMPSRRLVMIYTAHPGLNFAFLLSSPVKAKAGGGAAVGSGWARGGRLDPPAGAEPGFLDDVAVEPFLGFWNVEPFRGVGVSPGKRTSTGYAPSPLSVSLRLVIDEVEASWGCREARA